MSTTRDSLAHVPIQMLRRKTSKDTHASKRRWQPGRNSLANSSCRLKSRSTRSRLQSRVSRRANHYVAMWCQTRCSYFPLQPTSTHASRGSIRPICVHYKDMIRSATFFQTQKIILCVMKPCDGGDVQILADT